MEYYGKLQKAIDAVEHVIIGKDECVEKIMEAILAGGHVLVEDIPGVGKTSLALAFAKVLDLEQNRVQFSDVLPADITVSPFIRRNSEVLSIRKVQLCAICFWQMRSTVLPQRHSRRFWRRWKSEM